MQFPDRRLERFPFFPIAHAAELPFIDIGLLAHGTVPADGNQGFPGGLFAGGKHLLQRGGGVRPHLPHLAGNLGLDQA